MATGVIHIEEGIIVISSRDGDQFRDGGLAFSSRDMLARNLGLILGDDARRERLGLYDDIAVEAGKYGIPTILTRGDLVNWAWGVVGPALGTRWDETAQPTCALVFIPEEESENEPEQSDIIPQQGAIKPLVGCMVHAYGNAA